MSSDQSLHGYAQAPNSHHQNHARTSSHHGSKSKSRSRSTSQSRIHLNNNDDDDDLKYRDHKRHREQRVDSEFDLRQSITKNVDSHDDACSVCQSKHRVVVFHRIRVCKECLKCYNRMRYTKYGLPKYCKFTEDNSCSVHYSSTDKRCSYCHLMKLYSVGFHTIKEKKHNTNNSPNSANNVFKRLGHGGKSSPFKNPSFAQQARENFHSVQQEQSTVGTCKQRIEFGGIDFSEKHISEKTKQPNETNKDDAVNSTTGLRAGSEDITRSGPKNSVADINANIRASDTNPKLINNNVTTTRNEPDQVQQRRSSASEVPTTSRPSTCRICGTTKEREILHLYKAGSQPVMSCESCRQFIRKCKYRDHEYLAAGCCYGTGKCQINEENRRNCKYCRLQKCLRLHLLKLSDKKTNHKVEVQPPKPKEQPTSQASAEKPPVQNKPNLSISPIPIGKQQQIVANTTTSPVNNKAHSPLIDDYCRVCNSRDRVCKSYDAIMCHACISFYCGRNTGYSKMPSKCVTGFQNCEITPETRTDCRFCRLQKCYQAGCPVLVEQKNFASTSKTPSPKKHLDKQPPKASPVKRASVDSPTPNGEKFCSVCKDTRVVEKSYGCIMCAACRTFYYQLKVGNATKPTIDDCPGGQGNCLIDPSTRRNCRYCRLQQMFLMGCQRLVEPTRRAEAGGSCRFMFIYPRPNKFKSSSNRIKNKVVPVFNPRVKNQFTKNLSTLAHKPIKKCELCGDDKEVSHDPSSHVDILLCPDCQHFLQIVPQIKGQLKIDKCVLKEFNCEINAQTRGRCNYCRMRKLARVIKAKRKARLARKQQIKSSSGAGADHQKPTASSPVTLIDLTQVQECGACHAAKNLIKLNGAVICVPCRSFYARIKTKKKPVLCTGGRGDCEINEKTRMCCAYCRCKRLISIGIPIDQSKMKRKKRLMKPKALSVLAQKLYKSSAEPPTAPMATEQQFSPSSTDTQTSTNSPMELEHSDDSQQTIIRPPSRPIDQHDMHFQASDNEVNVQTTQTPVAQASPLPSVDSKQKQSAEMPVFNIEPLDLSKSSSNSILANDSRRVVTEIVELVHDQQQLDDVKPSTSGLLDPIGDVYMSTVDGDNDSNPINREISDLSAISRFFGDLRVFRAGSTTIKSADEERPLAEAKIDSAKRKLLPNPDLDHRSNLTPSLDDDSNTSHVRTITNLNFQLEQSSTDDQKRDKDMNSVALEQNSIDVTLRSFETVIDARPMMEAQTSAKPNVDSPNGMATIRHPDSVIEPDEDCDPDYVAQQEWEEIDCDL